MNTLSTKVLKTIVLASNTASKDKTRYDLNKVRLQMAVNGSCLIESTNGHILSQFLIKEAHNEKLEEPRDFYFDTDEIKQIKLLLKQVSYKDEIYFEVSTKETLLLDFGSISLVIPSKDVQWPDTYPVIPKHMPEAFIFSLNAELLMRLAKTLSPETSYVTLAIGGALSPIRVFAEGSWDEVEGKVGILMPASIESTKLLSIQNSLGINEKEKVA